MSRSLWLWVGLLVAIGAPSCVAWILRRRCRAMGLRIGRFQAEEARRAGYCETLGHHLDGCACTRCLASLHDYVTVDSKEYELRSELVNPRADPGALDLDSNFQPDPDYGRTRTVYQVVRTLRCSRCADELVTREERQIDDDP